MTLTVDLRAKRINRGLSAAIAAEEIGVNVATLRRAEDGNSVPQPRIAYAIASFYGLRVTDIWPLPDREAA